MPEPIQGDAPHAQISLARSMDHGVASTLVENIFLDWKFTVDHYIYSLYTYSMSIRTPKKRALIATFSTARLRALRELFGLSPAQFGAQIQRSGRSVRNWEAGQTAPSTRDLESISEQFCVDVRSLFVGRSS